MALEIERKFLVKNDNFKALAKKTIYIKQVYLTTESDCVVRIRIADERAVLTIKGKNKNNSIAHNEWEYDIPLEDAQEMMKMCGSKNIRKTRYLVAIGKHVFEIDVFHGENEGLVVAEVELTAEDEFFDCPDWIGEEVTAKERYYNAYLAQHPYKEWENSCGKI